MADPGRALVVQSLSLVQLFADPMDYSFPVLHYLLEFAQTQGH